MKNNRLSIGQMAKLNHTTLATLRLYDKMGLLSPAYTNPETGYRYYDVTQCATFHLIQNNKNLNMSLKDIKSILDQSDFHYLLDFYDKKMADLEKELAVLQQKRRTLKKIMEWTDFYQHRPPVGTFSLIYLPKRCLYTMPADRNYFSGRFWQLHLWLIEDGDHPAEYGIPDGLSLHGFCLDDEGRFSAGHLPRGESRHPGQR